MLGELGHPGELGWIGPKGAIRGAFTGLRITQCLGLRAQFEVPKVNECPRYMEHTPGTRLVHTEVHTEQKMGTRQAHAKHTPSTCQAHAKHTPRN